MKTIIRIEHLDGIGMFRSKYNGNERSYGLTKLENEIAQNILDKHADLPPPYCDNNLNMDLDDKEWFCAYKSIDQLQQWLTNEDIFCRL